MKKWILMLLIVLIILGAFALFALSSQQGSEVARNIIDVLTPSSSTSPPPLPD
jgi:hypothetical protein